MKDARLELRIEKGLMDRVDAARGDVSRTRWVERALERALSVDGLAKAGQAYGAGRATSVEPVAPRASSVQVPGVVRASSLVKQGVKPIPKRK